MNDRILKTSLLGCAGLSAIMGWASPAGATASIVVFPSTNPVVTITAPPAPTPLSLDLPFATALGTGEAAIQDGPGNAISIRGEATAGAAGLPGLELVEQVNDVLHFRGLSGPTAIPFHFLLEGTVFLPSENQTALINGGGQLEATPGGATLNLVTGPINVLSSSCMGQPSCFEVKPGTVTPLSLDLAGTLLVTGDVAVTAHLALTAFGGEDLDFLKNSGNVIRAARLVVHLPPGVSVTSDGGLSTPAPAGPPDLTITDPHVAQVVFDPDIYDDGVIDLVAGKPTVIEATVSATGASPSDTRTVDVHAILGGTVVAFGTLQHTLGAIPARGETVQLYFTPSAAAPTADFVVTVDPNNTIQETDETNNRTAPLSVAVKDTKSLYVAYLRVDCLELGGLLPSYAETVDEAGEYLRALYPVAPSHFTNQRFDASIICPGTLDEDFIALWLAGKLRSSGKADRIVGIAGPTWFQVRRTGSGGVSSCGFSTAFVLDGHWDAVAHEIGHTFELSHPFDPQDKWCAHSPGDDTAHGFWVEQRKEIFGKSLMDIGPIAPPAFPFPDRWIADQDYKTVFANSFVTSPGDPEILLVSGILHTNGQVDLAPFYRLAEGVVDAPAPGDFSVNVLDAAGGVLYSRPFDVRFLLMTDPPTVTDTVPFGLAVPYPQNAAIVQVQRSGQVLAKVRVTTKLLHDAVASIPDSGFTKNPAERRNALLNKIAALDQQLAAGDLTGARNELQHDIRKQLVDWLVNGYTTPSPLQLTKDQILSLVDELLQRLGS